MITSREPIWTALQTLLSGVTFTTTNGAAPATTWAYQADGVTKVGRRLKLWSDVPAAQQPACFLTGHVETDAFKSELTPGLTTLEGTIYVYIKTNDAMCIPAIDLNSILDGIDAVMAPSPVTGKQTLGGLVSHCRRDGKIMLDPGDLDGQGLAIIPIKILVP
jgi:hypothetical protein